MSPRPTVQRVDTLDLPGLAPYRTLRRPEHHRAEGIFVAEGSRVVERLLCSDLTILSLLLTPEWLARLEATLTGRGESFRIFLADLPLVKEIVGFHLHQGIMAVARVPREPEVSSLPSPHCLVALDGLHHADNVGVAVRNCAALGADGIIVGERSSSPYVRRSVRNSMGAVFTLPVFHSRHLVDTLAELARLFGTRIIAADAHGETPIQRANFRDNICIVVGNEHSGVSPGIIAVSHDRVRIPMSRSTDSLNVASALALFLHEAGRNRTGPGD
jgi:tRNA G18 (ribose-2'-O)-methylase SpoU